MSSRAAGHPIDLLIKDLFLMYSKVEDKSSVSALWKSVNADITFAKSFRKKELNQADILVVTQLIESFVHTQGLVVKILGDDLPEDVRQSTYIRVVELNTVLEKFRTILTRLEISEMLR